MGGGLNERRLSSLEEWGGGQMRVRDQDVRKR